MLIVIRNKEIKGEKEVSYRIFFLFFYYVIRINFKIIFYTPVVIVDLLNKNDKRESWNSVLIGK